MIIFLYGKDTYRAAAHTKKLMAKFRAERDPQGLNLVVIDCSQKNVSVLQELRTPPFLAEKRMVVITNLLLHGSNELLGEVLGLIDDGRIPEDIIVIFQDETESPKKKGAKELFARLKKEQFVQQFELMSGASLVNWILSEVNERGGSIDRAAASFLAGASGQNMWSLSTILDQLIAYTRKRSITTSDVSLFCEEKIDDNIFTFVDAIVDKKQKIAFTMLAEQYRQGQDAGYLYAMILRQFRILLELRDLYDRGISLSDTDLPKQLGLHPFVIKKSIPTVKKYPYQELTSAYEELLEIDRQTKTGQGDQSYLLDVFFAKRTIQTSSL